MECDDTDLDAEEAKNIFRRGSTYQMCVNGVEHLKRINRNTGKGRCRLCLGEEGYKHTNITRWLGSRKLKNENFKPKVVKCD